MTGIIIDNGQLLVEIEAFDKVLAVKTSISVDLSQVRGAKIDPDDPGATVDAINRAVGR